MNNKNTKLQFTELTQQDMAAHEDLYIKELLISGFHMPPGNCGQMYYDHAIKELQKANELFIKAFS